MAERALSLQLSEPLIWHGWKYQFLLISLTKSDRVIKPTDLRNLEFPSGIDISGGVVISGRAPIWLYAYLTHELHPNAWVACYDPRLSGAVVVATHAHFFRIGDVIPIEPPNGRQRELCPALMVVGPPDSGKSVLSHALFQALLAENPDIYLQRAHWDGEGNYLLELDADTSEKDIEAFKHRDRGVLTEEFFLYHSQGILKLRRQKSLVIVDVGGMVQPEKLPILEACSHYLIISSKAEAIDSWHEFCGDRGNLKPIAVINSVLSTTEIIHQQQPYLEMTVGPWIRGKAPTVPQVLLRRVRGLISPIQ
ncbi:CRISPR-associated ring nuclease Crn3/Csx3 [Umezakia ovalisporum]|uniref:CRISPR-associated ring nuclease Crn3/Csx3 n=2 Tax=Umezakia ovalisporum TaxID=75695 RepID=A0AA43H1Z5_9CYAN|nr:CRISPR-associated ring nuclease Crn3/Csx3 [Umezakia ovalisporum]MDH6055980.1 CRISPR-associated ring nuclease Crn3/Csx3 [Umezakia ovalisporum FSS-43]MDH6065298.1 CRISPR-associated ring nuclease Crn3/Csx3 [Umezakia ovalisporum FSS-62]MDH6066126.1 CRISPR-associated ring nuclease Crn3/Csx3 [Umezakia ovalisporum APH033B]MDH6072612.1 CRISPR-associated ring nuclease Crn3/Csx3 [Umezakia ovalisporum CobakiLakeA]MDH6074122.1 CRISPR-associated ring nuclease Crn3/Csx3 [Umezakia ovalisporum CS-1034]